MYLSKIIIHFRTFEIRLSKILLTFQLREFQNLNTWRHWIKINNFSSILGAPQNLNKILFVLLLISEKRRFLKPHSMIFTTFEAKVTWLIIFYDLELEFILYKSLVSLPGSSFYMKIWLLFYNINLVTILNFYKIIIILKYFSI